MDYSYIIFVVPALVLSIIAQILVKSRFNKYDRVVSERNITGAQAASILLRANGITDVQIRRVSGSLTDNYNPTDKTLNLSDSTFSSTSIAAIGVAAHETGHAIQHKVGYSPLKLRSTLVPVANIGSKFGPILALAGLFFGYNYSESVGSIGQILLNVGIVLYAAAVLFYFITLPVEFNASRRALAILNDTNTLSTSELKGAKKVLSAAAMTYVASALAALGSLLRYILLSKRRRR